MANASAAVQLQRQHEQLTRLQAVIADSVVILHRQGADPAATAALTTAAADLGAVAGAVGEGATVLGGAVTGRVLTKRAREERREETLKTPEGPHPKTMRQHAAIATKRASASECLREEAFDCALTSEDAQTHPTNGGTKDKWTAAILADDFIDTFRKRHTTAFSQDGTFTPQQAAVCMASARRGEASAVANRLVCRKLVPVKRRRLFKLRNQVFKSRFADIDATWGDRGRAPTFSSTEVRALHDGLSAGGRSYSRAEFSTAVTAALVARRRDQGLDDLADPPTMSDPAISTLLHEVAGLAGVTFSLATRSKSHARCVVSECGMCVQSTLHIYFFCALRSRTFCRVNV